MKTPITLFALLVSAVLAGCGGSVGGAKVMSSDQASPKALVVVMHGAVASKDWSTIMQLIAPDFRKPMRATLDAFRDYSQEADKTAVLLEQRVGAEPANRLRQETQNFYRELLPSPLEGAVRGEDIQWNRVEIRPDQADTAWVYVDGQKSEFHHAFILSKIDGVWYVQPLNTPQGFRKVADETIANLKKGTKAWRSVQKSIKTGQINAGNVNERLWPSQGAPPTK